MAHLFKGDGEAGEEQCELCADEPTPSEAPVSIITSLYDPTLGGSSPVRMTDLPLLVVDDQTGLRIQMELVEIGEFPYSTLKQPLELRLKLEERDA